MNAKACIAVAGLSGFLAVVLGAVGAHALKARADETTMALYHTANSYHFYHTLALFGVGVLAQTRGSLWLKLSAGCFVVGMLLFCGSLYLLALTGLHAMLAPFGGVLLMLGWLLLGIGALRPTSN